MRRWRARKVTAALEGDPAGVIAKWSAAELRIPSGPRAGEPFALDDWQVDFLRRALGPGIREAALSCGRKNGKTGLVAVALLAFLAGPLNRRNWRALACSLTGKLAGELRDAVAETSEASDLSGVGVFRSPLPGRIVGLKGARVDLLAADRATGHGSGADIALVDEMGLLEESQRPLVEAMLSSVSGRDGRMIAFSIRGHGPFMGEIEARADDPAVAWTEYAASPGAALDDREAWAAANPGLVSGIKSASYMADQARRALSTPAVQAHFRAYDLNLPSNPAADPIVSVSDWTGVVVPADALPLARGRVVIGFDAGGSTSMTAAALYWLDTGRFETLAAFPAVPSLADRGKSDSVGDLYQLMRQRGELETLGSRVTDLPAFPVPRTGAGGYRDGAGRSVRLRSLPEGRDAAGARGCRLGSLAEGGEGDRRIRDGRRLVRRPGVPTVRDRGGSRERGIAAHVGGDPQLGAALRRRGESGPGEAPAARPNRRPPGCRHRVRARPARQGTATDRGALRRRVSRHHARIRGWPRIRQAILERDGFRCRRCGRAGRLEVHHIKRLADGGSHNGPHNLETLCSTCHVDLHRRPRTARQAAWDDYVKEVAG